MKSVLILSNSSAAAALCDFIKAYFIEEVSITTSTELTGINYDLIIINTPIENIDTLTKKVTEKTKAQVLLITDEAHYNTDKNVMKKRGILIVKKPLNREVFELSLSFLEATHNRLHMLKRENIELVEKMEDIKLVSRAKGILISYLGMSEMSAHRYIEKQAMDSGKNRRAVAQNIIKTYEN